MYNRLRGNITVSGDSESVNIIPEGNTLSIPVGADFVLNGSINFQFTDSTDNTLSTSIDENTVLENGGVIYLTYGYDEVSLDELKASATENQEI